MCTVDVKAWCYIGGLTHGMLRASIARFDAVYSSPMARAHETSKVIAAELPGMSFETATDVAKRHRPLGEARGRPVVRVRPRRRVRSLSRGSATAALPRSI